MMEVVGPAREILAHITDAEAGKGVRELMRPRLATPGIARLHQEDDGKPFKRAELTGVTRKNKGRRRPQLIGAP